MSLTHNNTVSKLTLFTKNIDLSLSNPRIINAGCAKMMGTLIEVRNWRLEIILHLEVENYGILNSLFISKSTYVFITKNKEIYFSNLRKRRYIREYGYIDACRIKSDLILALHSKGKLIMIQMEEHEDLIYDLNYNTISIDIRIKKIYKLSTPNKIVVISKTESKISILNYKSKQLLNTLMTPTVPIHIAEQNINNLLFTTSNGFLHLWDINLSTSYIYENINIYSSIFSRSLLYMEREIAIFGDWQGISKFDIQKGKIIHKVYTPVRCLSLAKYSQGWVLASFWSSFLELYDVRRDISLLYRVPTRCINIYIVSVALY